MKIVSNHEYKRLLHIEENMNEIIVKKVNKYRIQADDEFNRRFNQIQSFHYSMERGAEEKTGEEIERLTKELNKKRNFITELYKTIDELHVLLKKRVK